jgi:hypothetical protein
VQFIDAPAFGRDGHSLFSGGITLWTPVVDGFLHDQNLGTRELLAAADTPTLSPPRQLSANGRAEFATYLAAAPHKAFAVSPKGGFAYRTRLRSADEASNAALAKCAGYAPNCALYAVDDQLIGKPDAGSR